MAYTGTPVVRNQLLLLLEPRQQIRIDSGAWWVWLETAACFSYAPTHTVYRLTVRKEKRRHGDYWYAYLKNDSKLHNAYVGRSAALTSERLAQVMQKLLEKVDQQQRALLLARRDDHSSERGC
jgi:hypothetical protein